MKEKKGFYWRKSIGNNQYIDDEFEMGMSIFAQVLLDAVCALIFVLAARIMYIDVYIPREYYYENLFNLFIFAFAISGIMELSYRTRKAIGRIIRWGLLVVGIACFVFYIIYGIDIEYFFEELDGIVLSYLYSWDLYYGSSPQYYEMGLGDLTLTLNLLSSVILFIILWIGKMVKKNMVMVFAPLIVLMLELLVGNSPENTGIVFMFVGVLIANISPWKNADFTLVPGEINYSKGCVRFFSWVTIGIVTFILCNIISNVGESTAKQIMVNAPEVKRFHADMVKDIRNMSLWDLIGMDENPRYSKITNDTPDYENIPVLELKAKSKIHGDVYLKGFYAGKYNDGVWEQDLESFETACEEQGFDSKEISNNIVKFGVDTLLSNYDTERLSYTDERERIYLTYCDASSRQAFFPYFVEIDSEDIDVEGDSRFIKERNLEEVSFIRWRYDDEYEEKLDSFKSTEYIYWESWYEEYVREHYLEVPENMKTAKSIARELIGDEDGYYTSYSAENQARLEKAGKVASWLDQNTRYSLNLPNLPAGEDATEYFLKTSKIGYCMHYASAAAMILRAMDVPARYASGYIVENSSIEYSNSAYQATILDNKAHAWVEIYLHGIGWVPYEVTKGYVSSTISQNPGQLPTPQPNSGNEPVAPQPEVDEETEDETMENQEETTAKDYTKDNVQKRPTDKDDNYGMIMDALKRMIPFLIIAGAVYLIVFIVSKLKFKYKNQLINIVNKKHNGWAIKLMNQRIYKKLRLVGKIRKSNIRDWEYEEILKKNYPEISVEDWECYMDIVKAAAFSRKKFSDDELEFCYEIYRRIIKNS